MKEEIYYVADSLGVTHEQVVERAGMSLPQLFVEGGLGGMVVITLFLIGMLFAAWKAPRWVREIGLGGLVTGLFCGLAGLYQIFDAMQSIGEVPPGVFYGGFKVILIPVLYGLIVYFISLVLRVIQKPRI